MAASVLQETFSSWNPNSNASTNSAFTSNCTVGSTLEAYIIWNTSTTPPANVLDSSGQAFTFQKSVFDTNDGLTLALYTFPNNQSTLKLKITATWAANVQYSGMWGKELGGVTTSPFQTANGQDQVGPGANTDAISSGLMTPTGQPAIVSSVSFDDGGNAASNANSGFVQGVTGWVLIGGGGIATTTSQSKRITSTSPIAATYSNATYGGTRRFLTVAAVYTEAGGGGGGNKPFKFYGNGAIQANVFSQSVALPPGVVLRLGANNVVQANGVITQTGVNGIKIRANGQLVCNSTIVV